MKKVILILIAVSLTFSLMAQEGVLFGDKIQSGGYGGFFTKIGQIDGQTGVFMGGQGAWIINHRIGLGGKGYAVINEIEVEGLQNVKLEFGCWGALLEYIIAPDKLVHVDVHSMIGAGSVRYQIMDYRGTHSDIDYSDDGFFVLEPGFDVVLNVSKFFRIGIGGTYRYVSGVSYENLSNSDLNAMNAHIVFKFGSF